jgi:hypothetical protein
MEDTNLEILSVKGKVEKKYKELISLLADLKLQMGNIRCTNQELIEYQNNILKTIKARVNDVTADVQNALYATSWDKLVIAFFGETNAGKSTIIETFRIQFEKDREKGTDGLIVGDGQQDFTKENCNYDMSINNSKFSLIDVPGIEGNESDFKDVIKDALRKAHCVFYVQGHNKKPDAETAKKIKQYLGDWVNVYSIQNIRNDASYYDEDDERKTLFTEKVTQSEDLIKSEFKELLGAVYKGNIPLQALLAMCSIADFSSKRPDLIRTQQKLLKYFGTPKRIWQFSQFQTLNNLVQDKSQNFTSEIIESNKQKLISLANNVINTLNNIVEKQKNDNEKFKDDLKEFKSESIKIINQTEYQITRQLDNCINGEFVNLQQSMYNIIDKRDNVKEKVDNLLIEFKQHLSACIRNGMTKQIVSMTEKISRKQRKFGELHINFTSNLDLNVNFNLNIDFNDAIEELKVNIEDWSDLAVNIAKGASIGAFFGPIGAGVGAGFGLLLGCVKKSTGDHGKKSAKEQIRKQITCYKDIVLASINPKIEILKQKLDEQKIKLIEKVDNDLSNLSSIDEAIIEIEQEINGYINKIKNSQYGTI